MFGFGKSTDGSDGDPGSPPVDPAASGQPAGGSEGVPELPPVVTEGSPTPDPNKAADPSIAALSESGFQHNLKSGKELAEAYVAAVGRLSQRDALSKVGEQVLPHMDKVQAIIAAGGGGEKADDPWAPPPLPAGWEGEMAKPEADRNSVVLEEARKHFAYREQKWAEWGADPRKLVEDIIMPTVRQEISRATTEGDAIAESKKVINTNRAFLQEPGTYEAVVGLVRDRSMPLAEAIELTKLRKGASSSEATRKSDEARKSDLTLLGAKPAGAPAGEPLGKSPTAALEGVRHPADIAMAVARKLGVPL